MTEINSEMSLLSHCQEDKCRTVMNVMVVLCCVVLLTVFSGSVAPVAATLSSSFFSLKTKTIANHRLSFLSR